MRNNKFYIITFFLILLIYNKFFECRPLDDLSNKLIILLFVILFIFTFRKLSYKKGVFILPVKYIISSLFLSLISSYLFWKQDLLQGILAIAPFSYFIIFFFLIKARIDKAIIVKVILTLAYICLILFFYQFLISSSVLFGVKKELVEDRGVIRIVFPGEGFMFFALFYYLNKLGKKNDIKYIIAIIPFFLMMLLQVTRIYILAFGLIAIYHFMIKSRFRYRVYGIIGFIICYLFYYNTDNKIVKGLRETTENDVQKKEDYIRLIAADYYLFDFPKNNATYILGNGAYNYNSSYGKKILNLNENENYYLDDLGILKGFVLFGVLFLGGYCLIFIKAFRLKVPDDKMYLKYYVFMILVLSLTTRANTNAGFGVVMISVLYLFEFANAEQKKKMKNLNQAKIIDKRFNYIDND